jgi:hypothetical protein
MNNMIIHYPELIINKNLGELFYNEIKKINPEFRVKLFKSDNSLHYTRFEKNEKFCQIFIAKYKRKFLVDYWKKGVCLAHSGISNRKKVALSINSWLIYDYDFKNYIKEYPFVIFNSIANDFENNNLVYYSWQKYLEVIPKCHPELKEFVFEAFKNNEIRKLFPFMSLNRFCFSRCTGYPYTTDCPYVYVEKGKITIENWEGKILGKTSVIESLKIILDNLQ